MNLPANGKNKTLTTILGIILYLVLALYTVLAKPSASDVASAVDRRVVVLETKLGIIEKQMDQNREDHQDIMKQLRELLQRVPAK
jgi:hypothetical protein